MKLVACGIFFTFCAICAQAAEPVESRPDCDQLSAQYQKEYLALTAAAESGSQWCLFDSNCVDLSKGGCSDSGIAVSRLMESDAIDSFLATKEKYADFCPFARNNADCVTKVFEVDCKSFVCRRYEKK